ncbi:hypothetical protein GRF29_96g1430618 [Pseudopithomyces chartarum]|uniref:F-box domain-containing protein n=1 Tax=Pseudopithomyces chartarum TaxID=1892770 RepID=A0AAN6LWK9_9PLEO|nr:hypothetical protein GRF29_96g1430618 [Pseudopithomyces chartarum]
MALATEMPQDQHDAFDATQVTLPHLPNELWLQILEQVDDIYFLWGTVRLVSKDYKAFVDRVFVASFLPDISISLSLPRRDPKTGHLRYAQALPQSEMIFQCRRSIINSSDIFIETSATLPSGETMQQLNESGALSKQRLDEAQGWMWFGRQRGKGVNIASSKSVQWDEGSKAWTWTVRWEDLVNRYCGAKRASKQVQRGPRRDISVPLRLR